jgi:hypothetical protein
VSESERLFKQRQELANQVIHEIYKLTERWEQRITLNNLRIVDRFLNFELHILLHIRVKTFGSVEMWGACISNQKITGHPVANQKVVASDTEMSSVFVDVVELVNAPQGVAVTPAFVWLKRINHFYRLWPDALYFSSLLGFVSSGILRNREFDSTTRFDRRRSNHGQLVCEMVERASKIMDNISSARNDINRQSESFVSGVAGHLESTPDWRIRLSDNNVSVIVPTRHNLRFEVCEVLLGPLDFYADKEKSAACIQGHQLA